MSHPQPQKLPFTICFCSGNDSFFPVSELTRHSADVRGWASEKNCKYPQEIELMFSGKVKIDKIQFLSHESKIPTRVEVFAGRAEADGTPYGGCKFKVLGYTSLSDNEKSKWRARELKTVHVTAELLRKPSGCSARPRLARHLGAASCACIAYLQARCLKLQLHRNHVNAFNPGNQVGLLAVCVFGWPLSSGGKQARLGDGQFNYSPANDQLDLNEMKPHRLPPPPPTNSNVDSLTSKRLAELSAYKAKAVREEDYDMAAYIKKQMDALEEKGPLLKQLEMQKQQAVAAEDFGLAKRLKVEVESIRNSLTTGVHAPGQPVMPPAPSQPGPAAYPSAEAPAFSGTPNYNTHYAPSPAPAHQAPVPFQVPAPAPTHPTAYSAENYQDQPPLYPNINDQPLRPPSGNNLPARSVAHPQHPVVDPPVQAAQPTAAVGPSPLAEAPAAVRRASAVSLDDMPAVSRRTQAPADPESEEPPPAPKFDIDAMMNDPSFNPFGEGPAAQPKTHGPMPPRPPKPGPSPKAGAGRSGKFGNLPNKQGQESARSMAALASPKVTPDVDMLLMHPWESTIYTRVMQLNPEGIQADPFEAIITTVPEKEAKKMNTAFGEWTVRCLFGKKWQMRQWCLQVLAQCVTEKIEFGQSLDQVIILLMEYLGRKGCGVNETVANVVPMSVNLIKEMLNNPACPAPTSRLGPFLTTVITQALDHCSDNNPKIRDANRALVWFISSHENYGPSFISPLLISGPDTGKKTAGPKTGWKPLKTRLVFLKEFVVHFGTDRRLGLALDTIMTSAALPGLNNTNNEVRNAATELVAVLHTKGAAETARHLQGSVGSTPGANPPRPGSGRGTGPAGGRTGPPAKRGGRGGRGPPGRGRGGTTATGADSAPSAPEPGPMDSNAASSFSGSAAPTDSAASGNHCPVCTVPVAPPDLAGHLQYAFSTFMTRCPGLMECGLCNKYVEVVSYYEHLLNEHAECLETCPSCHEFTADHALHSAS
eukprot:gene10883-1977_t